ncbi:MAG TPA: CvpA family protein [Gaiellaceae bacterium]|nr:CvpA family protein [Gaiellaceae bacterium]
MNRVDWIALAVIAVAALAGLRRGLLASALSLGGLALGAVIGARIAPHFLHDGSSSPYASFAALAGALVGALVLQSVASMAGRVARGGVAIVPPLRMLDSFGGLLIGGAIGLCLVWVAGAALLQVPGQHDLRSEVDQSRIVTRLDAIVSPTSLFGQFARFSPFELISGPSIPTGGPADPSIVYAPGVTRARLATVRIHATACGSEVEGSGWAAKPRVVVTAAHVVAGATRITANGYPAVPLYMDRTQDVAVLRVPGLRSTTLPLADARSGGDVAILGFPDDGGLDVRPGVVGDTGDVLSDGSLRRVTALGGLIRHGNSGGPAVDATGHVEATVFASHVGGSGEGGYGVPAGPVRTALARTRAPVSTGSC